MDKLVLYSAAGVVFGVLLFLRGFKRLQLRRRIQGMATSKVRSMAMGMIELEGLARPAATLIDPIFSRPCAYFRIVVKEKRGSGKRTRWVTIYQRDSAGVPFLLDDGSGVARVLPFKAEIHFTPAVHETVGGALIGGFQDGPVSRFVKSISGGWGTRSVVAHILRENEPVFVLGYASPAENSSMPVAVSAHQAARELKKNPAEMKMLDANGDGAVDAHEWESGVEKKSAELNARERARSLAASSAEPVITIGRCPTGLFVLADSQENLLSRLGMFSWLQIVAGPVVAIASGVYLFMKYQGH